MRNDRTYINEPYMQQSPSDGAIKTAEPSLKAIKKQIDEHWYLDKNDDLISRADAIEAVENKKATDPFGRYDKQNIGIDWAIDALKALPSADAVSGYTEWLEKIIVDAETIEWLCEDTNDKEWCDNNCHYSSIQAECLRHLYEVSKGGDDE